MANYKINFIKLVELNNGQVKKSATLTDDQGTEIKFVTVWPDFLNFANLAVGQVIEGQVKTVQNGQYTNSTLYPLNVAPKPQGGAYTRSGGGMKANMTAVMEKKQEGIRESQDNKERAIKIASTIRLATDAAIAEFNQPNGLDDLSTLIKKWRKWFWENWDVNNDQFAPF